LVKRGQGRFYNKCAFYYETVNKCRMRSEKIIKIGKIENE